MHGTHLGIFTVSPTMFSENLSAASEAFAKHQHLQSQHQPPLVLLSWGVRAGATHEKSEGGTGEIRAHSGVHGPGVPRRGLPVLIAPWDNAVCLTGTCISYHCVI